MVSLVVSRIPRDWCVVLCRYWVLSVAAARHSWRLVSFGLKNTAVLARYRRVCRRRRCTLAARAPRLAPTFPTPKRIGSWLQFKDSANLLRLHAPLTPYLLYVQYLRLIVPLPSLVVFGESQESARLRFFCESLASVSRRPSSPKKRDPLNCEGARRLQAAIAQNVFLNLLDIRLTDEEAQVLGRYGTVHEALHDFLLHCGYPKHGVPYELLEQFLPLFVRKVQMRHEHLTIRRRLHLLLRSRVRSAVGLGALLRRARIVAVLLCIDRYYAKQHAERMGVFDSSYSAMQKSFELPALQASIDTQEIELAALASEAYLRALRLASSLSHTFHNLDAICSSDSYCRFERLAFRHALRSLRLNFLSLLAQGE